MIPSSLHLLAQHEGFTSLAGKAESSEMPYEAGFDASFEIDRLDRLSALIDRFMSSRAFN